MAILFERPLHGGTQVVHRFDNGLGASVVKHNFSYGGDEGLWELAVITFTDGDNYKLNYDTPVTGDVLGRLNHRNVKDLLTRIESFAWSN